MALSKWSDGLPDDCLGAVSVDGRTKTLIKIKASEESFIIARLIDARAKNHALHDVGRAKPPDPASHHNVVGVMNLGLVVPASRLLWEG